MAVQHNICPLGLQGDLEQLLAGRPFDAHPHTMLESCHPFGVITDSMIQDRLTPMKLQGLHIRKGFFPPGYGNSFAFLVDGRGVRAAGAAHKGKFFRNITKNGTFDIFIYNHATPSG